MPLEVGKMNRTLALVTLLSVFLLAGCRNEVQPPPSRPLPLLTFVPANPAEVSGRLHGVAEQTFSEGTIYALTGFADAPSISYGALKGDGSFSFLLPEGEAERMAFPLIYELPETCHRLASDLSGNLLTVGFRASLYREDSGASATVVQASSHDALSPDVFIYEDTINVFSPHELVDAAFGEFVVFRTYADRALRVQGTCVREGQTAKLKLALRQGWNLVLVRREAASSVRVETIPGMPKQAKWLTLGAFRWF